MRDTLHGVESPRIPRKEWKFVYVVASLISVLLLFPYALGVFLALPHEVFMGIPLVNAQDYTSYLVWITQASHGEVLFYNYAASDIFSDHGSLLNPIFLTLGTTGRYTGISSVSLYHIASAMAAFLAVLTLYRFIATLSPVVLQRRGMLGLLLCNAGLGALIFLPPSLFNFPDFSLFTSFAESFLGSIDIILTLTIFLLCIEEFHRGRQKDGLLAGLILGFLTLVHPYAVPIIIIALLVFAIFHAVHTRNFHYGYLCGIALATMLPFAAWQAFALSQDPSFAMWFFSGMHTDRFFPAEMALGYGFAIPLALYGLYISRRYLRKEGLLFLLCWIAVMIAGVYQPFFPSVARRLGEFLIIPLVLLASIPIVSLWENGDARKLLAVIVATLMSVGNIVYYGAIVLPLPTEKDRTSWYTQDEVAAARWLDAHVAADDVILAGARQAKFLPAFVRARFYFGHPWLTPGIQTKVVQIPRVLRGAPTGKSWALLRREVDYIVVDDEIRMFGYSGGGDSCVEKVFESVSVTIFAPRASCTSQ